VRAYNIAHEVNRQTNAGWDTDSLLELACQYIDNQGDNAAFREFLERQAELEAAYDQETTQHE
jgi:hypothetical protein